LWHAAGLPGVPPATKTRAASVSLYWFACAFCKEQLKGFRGLADFRRLLGIFGNI
jgi:hypothetical protein